MLIWRGHQVITCKEEVAVSVRIRPSGALRWAGRAVLVADSREEVGRARRAIDRTNTILRKEIQKAAPVLQLKLVESCRGESGDSSDEAGVGGYALQTTVLAVLGMTQPQAGMASGWRAGGVEGGAPVRAKFPG